MNAADNVKPDDCRVRTKPVGKECGFPRDGHDDAVRGHAFDAQPSRQVNAPSLAEEVERYFGEWAWMNANRERILAALRAAEQPADARYAREIAIAAALSEAVKEPGFGVYLRSQFQAIIDCAEARLKPTEEEQDG